MSVLRQNDTTLNIILQDVGTSRVRPWREKKSASSLLSDSFYRLGLIDKASRVSGCGSYLVFESSAEAMKLKQAYFCRERLCPMCAWRRSLKTFSQVSSVMDLIQKQHLRYVPIFLTLTARNCSSDKLRDAIGVLLGAWRKLMNRPGMQRIFPGWFRALEVTYNFSDNTFHPHIHVILLVDESYFTSSDYLTTYDWVSLWRDACGFDYDPVCDIRVVDIRDDKHKNVADIAKYTVKSGDYLIDDNPGLTDYLVETFGSALFNRRLVAFGGVMKSAHAALNFDDVHDGDLVNVEGDVLRSDVATVIEVYRWNVGIGNYVKEVGNV